MIRTRPRNEALPEAVASYELPRLTGDDVTSRAAHAEGRLLRVRHALVDRSQHVGRIVSLKIPTRTRVESSGHPIRKRPGPSGRGIEPGVLQDLPDGRGCQGMAESDQLTLNSSVAPTGFSRACGARGRGSPVRWVVGLVVGAGRSSGGRRAGGARAAGFGVRTGAPGAAGSTAVCTVR